MRFSLKQSQKKSRTFFLLCGIALSTVACASRYTKGEVLKTTDYSVAPYTITEEVQYEYSDLGDDYYQRVYVVESPEKDAEKDVATFRGETTMWHIDAQLPGHPPMVVGDWLAVFSLEQVWIWQPGKEAITFEPIVSLESDVWKDNGLEKPRNAADYSATGFQLQDGRWILEYTDMFTPPENASKEPKHIYFISEDQGQTFVPQRR